MLLQIKTKNNFINFIHTKNDIFDMSFLVCIKMLLTLSLFCNIIYKKKEVISMAQTLVNVRMDENIKRKWKKLVKS